MRIILRNAKVFHPSSPYHGKRVDIFIKNKKIESIGRNLKVEKATEIKSKNLCVSIGWMDLGAQACDPGFEHREDLESSSNAAAAGGFTALAPFPNTQPVTQDKSGIDYIKNKTSGFLVDFFPIGAITRNCEGIEITEMHDMKSAGAVAFSDGSKSIQHSGVLMRALQYTNAFEGVIIHQPVDKTIAQKGQIHEGKSSTMLGLRGVPSIAESLMVQRDLSLNEYANSKLHFAHISTSDSVDLIKKAQRKGITVTAGVPAINLAMKDEDLLTFDTNLKINPPLREKGDITSLKNGLKDGTISCIVSNHIPQDTEAKNLEFGHAEFGAIGLQTVFAVASEAMGDSDLVVEKLAMGVRSVLGLSIPDFEEGAAANLTFYDPGKIWTLEPSDVLSKSKNSFFIGKELKGKVLGVVNNGMSFFTS